MMRLHWMGRRQARLHMQAGMDTGQRWCRKEIRRSNGHGHGAMGDCRLAVGGVCLLMDACIGVRRSPSSEASDQSIPFAPLMTLNTGGDPLR